MDNASALLIIFVALAIISIPGWYTLFRARQEQPQFVPPDTYQIMERTLADMSRRLSEMENLRQDDHDEMMRLRGEVNRIWSRLERWMAYAQRLAAIMRENKLEVPPSPEETDAADRMTRVSRSNEPGRLKNMIADKFSPEEIKGLAFDLGLAHVIKGETAGERAESLVSAVKRREMLNELIEMCRTQRPNGGF